MLVVLITWVQVSDHARCLKTFFLQCNNFSNQLLFSVIVKILCQSLIQSFTTFSNEYSLLLNTFSGNSFTSLGMLFEQTHHRNWLKLHSLASVWYTTPCSFMFRLYFFMPNNLVSQIFCQLREIIIYMELRKGEIYSFENIHSFGFIRRFCWTAVV